MRTGTYYKPYMKSLLRDYSSFRCLFWCWLWPTWRTMGYFPNRCLVLLPVNFMVVENGFLRGRERYVNSLKISDCRAFSSKPRKAFVPPEVDPPEDWNSIRPTIKQCIKLKRLSCYSVILISFSNVCRNLLTVLSKQLIHQLEFWTSSGLPRSKAKSFCFVRGASRPDIWGKKSVVMSVE